MYVLVFMCVTRIITRKMYVICVVRRYADEPHAHAHERISAEGGDFSEKARTERDGVAWWYAYACWWLFAVGRSIVARVCKPQT